MSGSAQRSRRTWSLTRKRMHEGKIPWSRRGAILEANRRVERGVYRESINIYPCPYPDDRGRIGHWHVGTRNAEHGRRRR